MRKGTFLAGLGVGYVLGARAGRQRYEQIMMQVTKLRENPQVQEQVTMLQMRATDLFDKSKQKVSTTVASRRSGADLDKQYDVVEIPVAAPSSVPNGQGGGA